MGSKPPPVKRMDLLKDRNAKLSGEVAVQRKEINRLQRGLTEATAREERLNETVLCVNRLWEELNGAIAFLNFRATGEPVPANKGATSNGDSLEGVNPFLARLLATHLDGDRAAATAAKGITEDPSDVETALRERMHATMEAAARVLEAVEAGAPGDATGKDPKIAALNNVLKAENGRLRDHALLDQNIIKELQAKIADREEELLVAQRKLMQLKEAGAGAGAGAGAAGAAAPAPAAPEAPAPAGDAAAPSTSAMEVDGEEVEQYKRQVAARAAEVQERDAALVKAERDIRDLKTKLASERSAALRAKQAAADRVRALESEVAALDGRLRDAHRECDHLAGRLREAEAAADRGVNAERRLVNARRETAALETALASARAKREAAEHDADRLRASLGAVRTGEELGKAVEALERDLGAAKAARDKHRAAAEGAAAARAAASQATSEAAEAKAQLETIRGRVEAARAEAATAVAAVAAAAEREEELRLFAEVAQTYLGGTQADADALRAQVADFLGGQSQAVAARLHEAQAAAAAAATQQPTPRETELQTRAEALEEERAVLAARVEALQREAEELRAAAEAAQEEAEAVQREVDGVAEAYEAAQEENARLLKAVASRDEDNVRLMSEAAAAMRERGAAAEDRGAAAEATRRAEEAAAAAAERADELEARVARLASDLDRAKKEARSAAARADAAVRDASAAQAAVDAATRDVEAARKEAAAAAAEVDAQAEALRREKTRAQQAKTDAAELKARLDRSRSGGGGDAEEVTALRSMVMCALCQQRVKNRIITICQHVFCDECVQERLSSRSRQCPGCQQKFGANDVKPFSFTH